MAHWQGTFPAAPAALGTLRAKIAGVAKQCGLSDARVADVKLAVSEAATNVVLHGYPKDEGTVTAVACAQDGELHVVIRDSGAGMTPRNDSPGIGLGLPLIAAITNSIEVLSTGEGTEVHLTFPLPNSQPKRSQVIRPWAPSRITDDPSAPSRGAVVRREGA